MPASTSNPFKPGTGLSPPYVAGRKDELDLIDKALRAIVQPRSKGRLQESPLSPIKIVGPRGVGKTTLLSCAREMAEAYKIQVVRLDHLKDGASGSAFDSLIAEMMPEGKFDHAFAAELKLPPDIAKVKYSARPKQSKHYVTILKALMSKKPVLFLMDEVMHYDEALLGMILQKNQRLLSEKWALAMIVAGTPALNQHLRKVNATFINRTDDIDINDLSDAAVREALVKPLKQRKIKVTDGALDLLASWTDNYPYFVQAAGRAVWDVLEGASGSKVDLTVVKKAEPAMNKTRKTIYHKVYEDLQDLGLANYANQAIAIVEEADQPLTPAQVIKRLAASNQDMDEQNAKEIFDLLRNKDLIWLAGKRRVYPSIPSFFTYFKQEYATDQQ